MNTYIIAKTCTRNITFTCPTPKAHNYFSISVTDRVQESVAGIRVYVIPNEEGPIKHLWIPNIAIFPMYAGINCYFILSSNWNKWQGIDVSIVNIGMKSQHNLMNHKQWYLDMSTKDNVKQWKCILLTIFPICFFSLSLCVFAIPSYQFHLF